MVRELASEWWAREQEAQEPKEVIEVIDVKEAGAGDQESNMEGAVGQEAKREGAGEQELMKLVIGKGSNGDFSVITSPR